MAPPPVRRRTPGEARNGDQVRYRRALSQAEEVQEITPDTLTAGYPGLGQSVAQVIHNTDERCKSLQ